MTGKTSSPQGKLTLSLNATDRILFIDATGPFDREFTEEYARQITPFRQALQPIAWGSLATLKGGENLLTEESRSFLVDSIKGARLLGLKVTALVLEEMISEREHVYWQNLYEETGLEYAIFNDKPSAQSFLTLSLQNFR